MALRAVSIVGLESSIRTQFDQRIERLQQSVREHHVRRRNSLPTSGVTTDRETERSAQNDIGETREENMSSEAESSNSNSNHVTENESPQVTPTNSGDMQESGDLGRTASLGTTLERNVADASAPQYEPRSTRTRANSVDIQVEYEAFPEVVAPSEDGDSIEETIQREIQGLQSNNNDRGMSCCKFYRTHSIGHLVTGILSGCLFVLLGVIFLVNKSHTIPIYAGITLIVLGLAPCCMALNRYRYARLYERERQRALRRLGALRRAHRRHTREERRRHRQAYSDLPPAYDNLGFDLGEDDPDLELDDISLGTFSSQGSIVLPTYDQCVKKERKQQGKESTRSKRAMDGISTHENASEYSEVQPPDFEPHDITMSDNEVVVVIESPSDNNQTEMIETRFEMESDVPNNDSQQQPNAGDDTHVEYDTQVDYENGAASDA